jgi:hypothetical protein
VTDVQQAAYRAELSALSRAQWPTYLKAHGGLPGPRGNLELMQALADEGDQALFALLIATDDEYLVCCGVLGLGRLLADGDEHAIPLLHGHARDARWRVREAVAMGLQRLGDADPSRLWSLTSRWVREQDPLVQRAVVAGACEPRLLRPPGAAARALDLCALATRSLAARPATDRRGDVRVLRQALGYCWSVAVAADPAGLERFLRLDTSDPDVAWIVRENLRKARVRRLLPA